MRNIIITNISALPPKPKEELKEQCFKSDMGDITGIYTNEAPIKYLLTYISRKKETADLIIAAVTPEAESAYEELEKTVNAFAEETGIEAPEMIHVTAAENEMEKTVDQITRHVVENDKVYIDTTGGFRNSSYLLMAVVRVLEYTGIGLTKAIYAKVFGDKQIIDITSVYRMFDLINAVNSFSHLGNSRQLEDYFEEHNNDAVKRTIKAMNAFSDEISLCRTSRLNDVLGELNNSLLQLSEIPSDEEDIVLLKSLVGTIRKKFGCTSGRIEYPAIVKWCLDNKMIQQAVTIYVEKMPEYFYRRKYFTVTTERFEKVKKSNEKSHDDLYYELFYKDFLLNYSTQKNKVDAVFEQVCSFSNEHNKEFKCKNKKIETVRLLYKALCECEDINTFNKRTTDRSFDAFELRSVEPEISRFIKVRKALYSDTGLRERTEREKRLSAFPEIAEAARNIDNLPNSVEIFFKSLYTTFKPLLKSILHPDADPKKEDRHLKSIDALTEIITESDYTLTDKLSRKQLQSIFRDIYYAKTYIRNKLNHASEEDSTSEELNSYFAENGYHVESDLSVTSITEFLYAAIEKLKL